MKKILLVAIVGFILAAPVFVSAQACPPGKSGLNCAGGILGQVANPEQTGLAADLPTAVSTVIKAVLALVGTIFLILTIYAGILWMTAQGEEEKVSKAKEIIKASVIGLIIIMSAYAITFFVTSRLTSSTVGSNYQANPGDQYIERCLASASAVDCLNVVSETTGNSVCYWTSDPALGDSCKPLQGS